MSRRVLNPVHSRQLSNTIAPFRVLFSRSSMNTTFYWKLILTTIVITKETLCCDAANCYHTNRIESLLSE